MPAAPTQLCLTTTQTAVPNYSFVKAGVSFRSPQRGVHACYLRSQDICGHTGMAYITYRSYSDHDAKIKLRATGKVPILFASLLLSSLLSHLVQIERRSSCQVTFVGLGPSVLFGAHSPSAAGDFPSGCHQDVRSGTKPRQKEFYRTVAGARHPVVRGDARTRAGGHDMR